MRAVAAALVLIVGAAVVLWYGNTLNSWVLGGLIGGLAALLLSIPISLTIFSFLARRHDERSRVNAYDEEYDLIPDYPRVPEQVVRSMYVVAEDRPRSRREVWEEEEEWDEGDEEEYPYRHTDAVRRIAPQEPPRLPAPGQQKTVPGLPAPRRNAARSRQLPASTKPLSERSPANTRQLSAREREITSRRPTRMNNAGIPGAEVPQSQLRSQALRTARLEAARQREEDAIEELPSYRPRRSPITRSSRPLPVQQDDEQIVSRSTQQGAKQYPRRPRQSVDTSLGQTNVPQEGKNTTWQPPRRQRTEPETEYIDSAIPDGDPKSKGDLKSSLVRRAPYMYEDDPLRKQLSQQVDGPITRRSSRNLATPQDEK